MTTPDPLQQLDQLNNCWCHQCHHDRGEWVQFMILCPDCGCKRCPKATHHDHKCTRSNDSGQAGSVYGDYVVDPVAAVEFDALMAKLNIDRAPRVADFKRRHGLKERKAER